MEVQLLHPQKKSRKWRPSLKKLFQRKKKLPEGDLKYFSAVDKFDPSEQDQTSTVNLSTASESNGGTSSSRLHSGDEHSSDDSASMGPQSRGGHRLPELRRRSSTPVPLTHKLGTGAPGVVAEEHFTYSKSLTEDFAQLDVPSMEVHRTSSLWRKGKKPFVYKRNARSLDIPRNKNCYGEYIDKESPIFLDADEEEGTEVVLFETASGSDNENDNGHETSSQSSEEGIFLSLQAPLHRSTTSKSQPEQQQPQQQELLNRTVSLSAYSDMVALRRLQPSPSAALYTTDDVSPTLSKDVTWVSHDEDFSSEDDRPVKEIVFPTLTGSSLEPLEEEETLGGSRGGLLDPEYAAIEVDVAMSRSREEVRDAIFASLEEEEEQIIFDHRRFDDDFDSLSLEDFDPPQGDTKTSPKPSPKPTEDTKTKLWDSGVLVDTIALLAPSADEPLERPLSSSPRRKAHSTAFIKRKSAFSGQDLLSREAECFAEFLEESGDDLSAIQADPHDIFSPEDRFLSAINASMMDDDGFPSLGADAPATAKRSTSVKKETYTSLERSLGGGSSDMYTKSLSYDTSSISHSQGASFPSYSSSKGPSINGPNDVYCGARIFPREEDDDDDDDDDVYDDDFTEDSFSSQPSDNIHKQRRGGRKNRHPTTTLEDIRLDVLEAVQDMARSASSNMLKFLQD